MSRTYTVIGEFRGNRFLEKEFDTLEEAKKEEWQQFTTDNGLGSYWIEVRDSETGEVVEEQIDPLPDPTITVRRRDVERLEKLLHGVLRTEAYRIVSKMLVDNPPPKQGVCVICGAGTDSITSWADINYCGQCWNMGFAKEKP